MGEGATYLFRIKEIKPGSVVTNVNTLSHTGVVYVSPDSNNHI